jgi:hypothetical protein
VHDLGPVSPHSDLCALRQHFQGLYQQVSSVGGGLRVEIVVGESDICIPVSLLDPICSFDASASIGDSCMAKSSCPYSADCIEGKCTAK